MAELDWIGRAVSIVCDDVLGVFQGIIKNINAAEITIVRAFRNGVPLRQQNAEVVLKSSDILKINLIPAVNGESVAATTTLNTVINKPTPVKLPNFSNILGAKQQQELQLKQQQKQQQSSANVKPSTPKNARTASAQQQLRLGTPKGSGNGSGGGIERGNSTLSNKMQNMKLNSNGLRSTPNNVRSASAQQQQQQHNHQFVSGSYSNKSSPPNGGNGSNNKNNTTNSSVATFFGNLIPAKVEVKLGASLSRASSVGASTQNMGGGSGGINNSNNECYSSNGENTDNGNGSGNGSGNGGGNSNFICGTKPIDIIINGQNYNQQQQQHMTNGNGNGGGTRRNGNVSNGLGNGGSVSNNNNKKQQRNNKVRRENSIKHQQTFGTSVDDPQMHEDFDFEGNLALFDKQAIWDVIESEQKPDVVRHAVRAQKQRKYRHDENILVSEPLQLRQIQTMFDGSKDFVTDEGLVIPTIPNFVRAKIELTAEKAGLSWQRQTDILARGASDLAISLLGGARRLTPNNCHQWPKVAIICDDAKNKRTTNIAAATGRQLAAHGLTVLLYLEPCERANVIEQNVEISLFKATDNTIVHSVDALPKPDLVILSTHTINLPEHIQKWLSENRASILSIDPPPCGLQNVAIKYSLLPILPLNGISSNNCGKLYLCNLGIPDKFYRDCGIKYKSPYGHKYVIPIHHSKD